MNSMRYDLVTTLMLTARSTSNHEALVDLIRRDATLSEFALVRNGEEYEVSTEGLGRVLSKLWDSIASTFDTTWGEVATRALARYTDGMNSIDTSRPHVISGIIPYADLKKTLQTAVAIVEYVLSLRKQVAKTDADKLTRRMQKELLAILKPLKRDFSIARRGGWEFDRLQTKSLDVVKSGYVGKRDELEQLFNAVFAVGTKATNAISSLERLDFDAMSEAEYDAYNSYYKEFNVVVIVTDTLFDDAINTLNQFKQL